MAEKADMPGKSPLENGDMAKDTKTEAQEDDIDRGVERQILRKIDLNLISIFGALYLMSFLGDISVPSFSQDNC